MLNSFIWSEEILKALGQLSSVLRIDSDEDCQLAYSALQNMPVSEDVQQQLGLNILRELISQGIEQWNNNKNIAIDDLDGEKDYALLTLHSLKKQLNLKARDFIPLLGSKTLVSLIFSGKRQLTREHIAKLCVHFKISPALFFAPVVTLSSVATDVADGLMDIEAELRQYLQGQLKRGRFKQRNIDIVCFYYGFSEHRNVTLGWLADKYGFSNRERPRQILFDCLQRDASLQLLSSLKQVADILSETQVIKFKDFKALLKDKGLLKAELQVDGLLKYLHLLDLCQDFAIFTYDLKQISLLNSETEDELWLISQSVLEQNKPWIKKMYSACGYVGLACFDEFASRYNLGLKQQRFAKILLENNRHGWMALFEHKLWYIFADRKNRLMNDLGKIFSLVKKATPKELGHCLNNGIHNRTQKFAIPSPNIIIAYLKECEFCEFDGRYIRFNGELTELTSIEKHATTWLKNMGLSKFPPLRAYLDSLGYSKPNIDKNIGKSCLVYVDRSAGRAHYTYRLIGDL